MKEPGRFNKLRAYRNVTQILTLEGVLKKDGRRLVTEDLSVVDQGAIVVGHLADDDIEGEIVWVGPDKILPKEFENCPSTDLAGYVLTPGLVDAHTHLIFAGDRSREFAMRLAGATYQEIAQAGGGITNSMSATRKMGRQELWDLCQKRVETIYAYGVRTLEIKSGYGLSLEKELELSRLIADLARHYRGHKSFPIKIVNTFMAAHAVPPEYKAKCGTVRVASALYLKEVVLPLLSQLHQEKIIDAVDIFHEENYFTEGDVRTLFAQARSLEIPRKMHADEFINSGGAKLAVEYGALSADHLLQTDDEGIRALAGSSTVANLLPGTGFFLGKKQVDARKFLDAGVKVAISSDYNPGSCHCDNVLLIASFAAPQYKMNLAEFWAALTLNASSALGTIDQGAIIPGRKAIFSLFKVPNHERIPYDLGKNHSTHLPKL